MHAHTHTLVRHLCVCVCVYPVNLSMKVILLTGNKSKFRLTDSIWFRIKIPHMECSMSRARDYYYSSITHVRVIRPDSPRIIMFIMFIIVDVINLTSAWVYHVARDFFNIYTRYILCIFVIECSFHRKIKNMQSTKWSSWVYNMQEVKCANIRIPLLPLSEICQSQKYLKMLRRIIIVIKIINFISVCCTR